MISRIFLFLGIPGFITGVAYFMDGNVFGPAWVFDMVIYILTGWFTSTSKRASEYGQRS